MKIIKRLECWAKGHNWQNDNQWPVHGGRDTPYPESYCSHCGITGAKYLHIKKAPQSESI